MGIMRVLRKSLGIDSAVFYKETVDVLREIRGRDNSGCYLFYCH